MINQFIITDNPLDHKNLRAAILVTMYAIFKPQDALKLLMGLGKLKLNLKLIAARNSSFRFRNENYVVFSLKQAYSRPATDCGLMEGKLSTDDTIRLI